MKIINFKDINKNTIVASFDVVIEEWGITIKRCGLFQKGLNRWVGFPTHNFVDTDGTKKYTPYVFMEKSRKDRFDKSVLALIDAKEYQLAQEAPVPSKPSVQDDEECPF